MFGNAQRVIELELQPGGIVERGVDELLQIIEAAETAQAGTLLGVWLGEGALGQFGGDRHTAGVDRRGSWWYVSG